MRYGDLFQLIGHLVLFAAEQVGQAGEISMAFDVSEDKSSLRLIIICQWPFVAPLIDNDYLSSLRSGSFHWSLPGDAQPELPHAMESAQHIADRCGTGLEFKRTSSGLKLRVSLPLVREQPLS